MHEQIEQIKLISCKACVLSECMIFVIHSQKKSVPKGILFVLQRTPSKNPQRFSEEPLKVIWTPRGALFGSLNRILEPIHGSLSSWNPFLKLSMNRECTSSLTPQPLILLPTHRPLSAGVTCNSLLLRYIGFPFELSETTTRITHPYNSII